MWITVYLRADGDPQHNVVRTSLRDLHPGVRDAVMRLAAETEANFVAFEVTYDTPATCAATVSAMGKKEA